MLVRPMLRSYLAKSPDNKLDGGGKVGVSAADDARLTPEAQRFVIDSGHPVRFLFQKNLRGRETKAVGRSKRRKNER